MQVVEGQPRRPLSAASAAAAAKNKAKRQQQSSSLQNQQQRQQQQQALPVVQIIQSPVPSLPVQPPNSEKLVVQNVIIGHQELGTIDGVPVSQPIVVEVVEPAASMNLNGMKVNGTNGISNSAEGQLDQRSTIPTVRGRGVSQRRGTTAIRRVRGTGGGRRGGLTARGGGRGSSSGSSINGSISNGALGTNVIIVQTPSSPPQAQHQEIPPQQLQPSLPPQPSPPTSVESALNRGITVHIVDSNGHVQVVDPDRLPTLTSNGDTLVSEVEEALRPPTDDLPTFSLSEEGLVESVAITENGHGKEENLMGEVTTEIVVKLDPSGEDDDNDEERNV